MTLDARIPAGPIAEKWSRRRDELRLVAPANRRRYRVIVVGTGLAGASAAASLGELGYEVEAFCYQPRGAGTASRRKGGSTLRRTTRTTATACCGSSATPSRGGASARARPTSTDMVGPRHDRLREGRECGEEHSRAVRGR